MPTGTRSERRWLLWGLVAALIGIAAIAAIVATRGGDDASTAAPATVAVEGEPLPPPGDGTDPAAGLAAPGLRGSSIDGRTLAIPAGRGNPRLVVFLAHWCPHCQAEVPRLVQWVEQNGPVEGVDVYAVATANDDARPNAPAGEWLERERWPYPTLLDDETDTAARAYGVAGYPFFVLVDPDGNVVARQRGEVPVEQLVAQLTALAAA